MVLGDNTVYIKITEDADQLASDLVNSTKAADTLDEHLKQVIDTIKQIAEAYQTTFADAVKIMSDPENTGGRIGLFNPDDLNKALEQLDAGTKQAGETADEFVANYRAKIQEAISSIEELTSSEEGISVSEAKLALGPLGTKQYKQAILDAASSAMELRDRIAASGDIAQTAFGVTSTEAIGVFTESVQKAVVSLQELQTQGMSLQQGKEALGPLGSGEYSNKVLQAATDTIKFQQELEKTGQVAQDMGITAGESISVYREQVAAATAAIQQLITTELAASVEEAKVALGPNGSGQFSTTVINAAAKSYEALKVELDTTLVSEQAFSQEELVGADAVTRNNENVAQAVVLLQDMVAELGQVSSAQAKASLTGYGFSGAEITQATQDFQALGGAFTDTAVKKDKFTVNVGALGDMMRYVRLSAFLIFMTALNDIKQMFQDAVKDAVDFSNAIFQLDVAVRAYQRDGFDVSLKQVHDQIAAIQKLYPYFDVSDMDASMAKLLNSTREFGVTSQQAFQLYGDAAKIAIMSNTTMEEAVNKLMTAVTSGAHAQQALRTLGIAVNSDLELAFEKEADALDDSTNKMTLQEKAAAALGLIHKYLALTADDVASKQDTLAGETDTVSAAWKNFLTMLGTLYAPIMKGVSTFLLQGIADLKQYVIIFE